MQNMHIFWHARDSPKPRSLFLDPVSRIV